MNNREKTLLALSIIVTTIIAFGLTVWTVFGRLMMIRATIGTMLPAWVKCPPIKDGL